MEGANQLKRRHCARRALFTSVGVLCSFAPDTSTALTTRSKVRSICQWANRGIAPKKNGNDVRSSPLYSATPLEPISAASKDDKVQYSNFWGTFSPDDFDCDDAINPSFLPCDPYLDPKDGPLPRGAYQYPPANPTNSDLIIPMKPISRLSVAVDVPSSSTSSQYDPDEIVRNLQRYIDGGITTFQLTPNGETLGGIETLFGGLVQDTPSHVLDCVNLVLPLAVPSKDSVVTESTIRASVLDLLDQVGTEAIDTLQLQRESNLVQC